MILGALEMFSDAEVQNLLACWTLLLTPSHSK